MNPELRIDLEEQMHMGRHNLQLKYLGSVFCGHFTQYAYQPDIHPIH
jgi:hypothetical protein